MPRVPLARAVFFLSWGGALLFGACARETLSRGLAQPSESMNATLAPPGDIGLDPPTPNLRQITLPSGLRVGFEQAPTRGMVGVVLVVGAASTADPPGKEGLAHLVEHLSYHARFDGRQVSDVLALLGATYNADTTLDRTRYYEFAPRAALPALLRLAAQRLAHPLDGVDARAVAVEREIVENELHQRNETLVYGQVAAWMQRALFPSDHPYARPVGGSDQTVRRLTLDDARAFAAASYSPRNATLLVIGDFDPAAAAASAARELPPSLVGSPQRPHEPIVGAAHPPPAFLPAPPPNGFDVMKAGVAWPEIWIAYYMADMYGPYAPAMKVLTAPVIVKGLRDVLLKDDDVIDVALETTELRQATVLLCRITLLSDRRRNEIADRARRLIASPWQASAVPYYTGPSFDMTAGGFNPGFAALNKTRRLALADAVLESESFVGRAVTRAEYFHMTGAVNAYDALIHAVATLPPDALVRHGLYLLAPERARVLFLEPLPDDERPPPGLVGVPSAGDRRGESASSSSWSAALDFGDPPAAPDLPELAATRQLTLPNGLRVVLVQRKQLLSFTAVLSFHGGAAASPAGVVELLRLLEREGTFAEDQNALEIRKTDGDDYAADMVVAGSRNLSNALSLLAARLRVIGHIHWPQLLDQVRRSGANLPRRESPAKIANRSFWHALYPGHPYGRSVGVEQLMGIDAAQAQDWLPRLYNPANATLIIAGAFNTDWAEEMARLWFADWQGDYDARPLEVPPVAPPPHGEPHKTVLITHRPGSTQVNMLLGCRLPGGPSPRALATAHMLAGVVADRLGTRLREEMGAAYTVGGSADVLSGGGAHIVISAAIDNRRFREALQVIGAEWDGYSRGGFDRGSLSQVRWGLVRGALLGFQTSADTAQRVLDGVNRGWSPATLATFPDVYRAVGPAELARAFDVCRSTTVMSLLGDQPSIEAALR